MLPATVTPSLRGKAVFLSIFPWAPLQAWRGRVIHLSRAAFQDPLPQSSCPEPSLARDHRGQEEEREIQAPCSGNFSAQTATANLQVSRTLTAGSRWVCEMKCRSGGRLSAPFSEGDTEAPGSQCTQPGLLGHMG